MQLPIFGQLFGAESPDHYLAIDLGTDVAKVAIFKPPSQLQAAPQTLGTGQQKHGLYAMRGNTIADFDAVLETVDLAIKEAQLHAGLRLKDVIIGLAGAAIKNIGVTVRIKRTQPEEQITDGEFSLLSEKIEAQTLPKAQEALGQLGHLPQSLEQVGTYFTGYQIDGAKVDTPLQISGQTLQTQVLHAFIDTGLLKQVNQLADQLNLKVATLVDTTVSITSRYLEDYEAGIVVDLGGQVTEVVLFNQRKILGNLAFNLGSRDLTEAIQENTGETFDAAEKLKTSFIEGHLDAHRAQEVRASIKPVLDVWVDGLEVTLRQFGQSVLPPSLLLVGASAVMEEVKSSLVAHPWNRVLPFSEFPKIEVIGDGNIALKSLTETQL